MRYEHLVEKHCKKCGKLFIPSPDYIFGEYCCWTCYNHRNDGAPKKSRGVAQCTLDGEVIRTFSSAIQAAEFINGAVNGMRQACKDSVLYKGYFWRYIQ